MDFLYNVLPKYTTEYEDDIAIYGIEASMEKLALKQSLQCILPKRRCVAVSGIWLAVVFLGCSYPDETLEDVARDLLRVPSLELRASVCRRFVDALENGRCRRGVLDRIRTMLL